MQPQDRTVERELARIAHEAHGVVTRAELERAGVTAEEIKQRVCRGALIRVHRGVYRVGHRAPSREARYLAAVRACGEGPAPAPEVTAVTERHVPGVITHRCRRLDLRDKTLVHGIPTTSVARTLVDVAGALPDDRLGRVCHEADFRHHTTPDEVEEVLARRPTAKGAARLRAILHGETRVTLSELERRFLVLLDERGLPLPQTNVLAGGRRVDARWPEIGLTVELDGYRFHRSRHAWEQDRRREREAHARGDAFRRYTRNDVFEDPRLMLRELRGLLDVRRLGQAS